MKIELETYELVALQRTPELEEIRQENQILRRELEEYRGLFDRQSNRVMELECQLLNRTAPEYPTNRNQLSKLAEAFSFIKENKKINAIKAVREALHCGLKEAKDIVEGKYPTPTYPY